MNDMMGTLELIVVLKGKMALLNVVFHPLHTEGCGKLN